jgi:cbb3-type cytochrome oxidase subunit 3
MTAAALSGAGLAGWAVAAMFLFMTAFALVTLRALATDRAELERRARLPLDEEDTDVR